MCPPMAHPGIESRRDRRYAVRIPATILGGRNEQDVVTEDIGLRGLFVRTDRAPALRQLVRVRITLPPDGRVLVVHCMVVDRVAPGTPGRAAGADLQLYAIDRATEGAWHELLAHVSHQPPAAAEEIETLDDHEIEVVEETPRPRALAPRPAPLPRPAPRSP